MHGPKPFIYRTLRAALSVGAAIPLLGQAAPGAAAPAPQLVYSLDLPGGQTAKVFNNGVAAVFNKDRTKVEFRSFPVTPQYDEVAAQTGLPDKGRLTAELAAGAKAPFAEGRVIVVFASSVTGAGDVVSGRAAAFTNDPSTNDTLAGLGVDRSERLFRNLDQGSLATMRAGAEADLARPLLDFSNAYRLHLVTGASVHQAVNALRQSPAVVYASPDFRVASTQAISIPVPAGSTKAASAAGAPQLVSSASVPSNFALTSSAQSLLNAPATDAAAAFDEIDRQFHQLPGQGQIITNVSLGDLDDASVINNFNDPCGFYATFFGPTTVMIAGQRYLNWPSMPLIPTYTSNQSGQLNGSGEVCGIDPYLGEIGLDFSMMAPLPHALQRAGEVGSGLTDLLGIAPGASYRLIVPAPEGTAVTITDLDGAFLAAGMQVPAPNVITASLGFSEDQYGFSGRYLEDDPLTEAIIASLVSKNIVVTVSSGDGLRTFTNAAVAPSGGSTPTQVIERDDTPSNLNDVFLSGAPSLDFDSGSIDVGGTTLNDINSAPPQDPAYASLAAQHAFPETRWNGFTDFSSGYGSRVNVSAPSDNVLGFSHTFGGAADAVDVNLTGGTSASAPETAAAAAVIMQVAQLTGQSFANARQVRRFLAQTATQVPAVPQSDVNNFVGPQIDVRRAVERLLQRAHLSVGPAVPRVAVAQRRNYSLFDAAFLSATDPTNIDLLGPVSSADGTMTGRNAKAWITIAPDWEGLPDEEVHFALKVGGKTIATTRWARLLPEQILAAAGLPLASTTSRTVNLTYQARSEDAVLAQAQFSLTFGPAASTTRALHAPLVPAVVNGATIPVTYDLTGVRNVSNPALLVSEPGRINPSTGSIYRVLYSVPLTTLTGTVQIPVSALQGGGIYGINILFGFIGFSPLDSDFAYTRVSPAGSSRPPAPLLSQNGSNPGHLLEVPYGGSFELSWDVSGAANADGAMLEVSAPGPGTFNDYNPFNNPNGTLRDNNGADTGSVAFVPLPGVSGTVTLNAKTLGLVPTLNHVVRVLPTRSREDEGGAQSRAAGEAGEVSTITMDGVLAADGGFANNGFGIDQNGNVGFLTSGQQFANGTILTSLETFDQSSNAIVQTAASQPNALYFTNGWGIWGSSVGLFGLTDFNTGVISYNLLNPAAGTIGTAWTPPAPNSLVIHEGAANQANDQAVFFAFDTTAPGNTGWRFLTSNITQNTFGPLIDLTPTIATMGLPVFSGIGQNTSTNQAAAPVGDFFNFCAAPTIVVADLGSGTLSSFLGVTSGFPYGMAVDAVTNKAVVPTICDSLAGIYDLGAKTGIVANPGGFTPLYPAIDQTHALILMVDVVPGDFGLNNNAMSSVVVMNEGGSVLATHEQFFFFNSFLSIAANNLQLNPATRTGWTFGPGQQQLAPFSY